MIGISLANWIRAAGVTPSTLIACRIGDHLTVAPAKPYGFTLAESASRERVCEVSWPAHLHGIAGHWWAIVRDKIVLAGGWTRGDLDDVQRSIEIAKPLVAIGATKPLVLA